MARTAMTVSSGGQIAEHLSIGVLAQSYPIERIRAILEGGGWQSQRVRDLPAEVVVYYVIALGLFMAVSTGEVLRCLLEGLRWLGGGRRVRVAGKSAISQARSRLGAQPLKALWEQSARPLASPKCPGAFYANWRLVAIDGSTLDVPDTEENLARFGKQDSSRGEAAFPQLRFVGLVECGSHALLETRLGAYRDSEAALAGSLLPALQPGMLCLADRLYSTYPLWQKALASGAQLLWRARRNLLLPVEEALADGSYLSSLYPSTKARRHRQGAIRVRVIDYELSGIEDAEPFYRLLTTMLDPREAPAAELAALYPQRWEIEGFFDELKTHLRGGQVTLRSKTPVLVEQEFYGLLLAHRAVRALINEATEKEKIDPDVLSFTHALRIIRRKLVGTPALSP
jgi:hypothetical protein